MLETGSVDDAGKSAVQEGVTKNRTQAEMELYQFAVQQGFLPNKHRLQHQNNDDNIGIHTGWSNTFN
jgi:hypothetical protein